VKKPKTPGAILGPENPPADPLEAFRRYNERVKGRDSFDASIVELEARARALRTADAEQVLSDIGYIRDFIARGEPAEAARWALFLGVKLGELEWGAPFRARIEKQAHAAETARKGLSAKSEDLGSRVVAFWQSFNANLPPSRRATDVASYTRLRSQAIQQFQTAEKTRITAKTFERHLERARAAGTLKDHRPRDARSRVRKS
jgi:hypothetical protein